MLSNSEQGCNVDDERMLNSGEKMRCQVAKEEIAVVFESIELQECTEPQCCTACCSCQLVCPQNSKTCCSAVMLVDMHDMLHEWRISPNI